MQIRKEIKVGLMVLVAMTILIWGFHFLKGKNIFVFGTQYYGVYKTVEGLTEGSPVFYRGYRVGTVRQISLHPDHQGAFLIALVMNEKMDFPDNSVAQLYSVDLMGTKAIQFIPGDSPNMLSEGDTLNTNVVGGVMDQVSMEFLPLKEKTEILMVKLDTVFTNINNVFSQANKAELNNAIKSFSATMDNFQESSGAIARSLDSDGHIGGSLQNLESFTQTLQQQSENLQKTMDNLAAFSGNLSEADIAAMVNSTDSVLSGINDLLAQANEGNGSLGLLMKDAELYYNLADASANLDRLLADLRHNPGRYLHFSAFNFGRKVYVQPGEELAKDQNIVFKVMIAKSREPLDIRNEIVLNDKVIFEDTDGDRFIYTVGETNSFTEAVSWKEILQDKYPGSEVISLQNGKPIRLSKALRLINYNN